jgi:hypothetical protein
MVAKMEFYLNFYLSKRSDFGLEKCESEKKKIAKNLTKLSEGTEVDKRDIKRNYGKYGFRRSITL